MFSYNSEITQKITRAEVLLLGCSAGGFNFVYDLLLSIPSNFPIPVVVVIHRSRKYKSSIESLLQRKANIQVKLVEDKEKIKKGVIYFAPSDYHVLLEPDKTFTLDDSELIFYCRPSIDVTFESLSDIYLDKVIGILLSGANEDGADGIAYIEANNGLAVVQDPLVAEVKTMPEAAIRKCKTVVVLNNEEIFRLITQIHQISNINE